MRIGIMAAATGTLDEFVATVKRAESDGFAFVSVPNIFGHDAIGAITVAGRESRSIELATAVYRSAREGRAVTLPVGAGDPDYGGW